MLDMLFTDVTDLASPQAAVAIATGDLVAVTSALALVTFALGAVGCVIGILQIRVVSRGIDKMTEASERRDRRYEDAMKAEANRHKESMKALDAVIRNTARRNRPVG
ncbi:MAG: hypothetical protein OXE76_10395 [Alphaproteobacteria bacterium]|nr:hypothetical protein [Alphaproteobacteria bacterium]